MEISNLVQTQGDGFLIRLPSSTGYLYALREYLIRELSRSICQADLVHIISGVMESVENAMLHGNQRQEDKIVEIMYWVTPEFFRAVVTDEGEGFDVREWLSWYENVWKPSIERSKTGDTPFNLTDYPTHHEDQSNPGGGLGLCIIYGFMDVVKFNDRGNQVILEKRLRPGASG